jgi:hypothetical protein
MLQVSDIYINKCRKIDEDIGYVRCMIMIIILKKLHSFKSKHIPICQKIELTIISGQS